ncbi:MAG: hypothetical protein A2556_00630 [Candidatus Vogelbacteria bacterium RIFOXYD2_FULL_44_9]|uniref:Uncharacterized protein n=1 Tax=Candidatus Vogelbacteria bacterium RIFOXYD2_FULL_44_9 TaxID=1802441 RepID=A0A1G2QQP8_9BACT|nr:MAG: hypothetical protein A2556_00630 [Candidatus Vogelbacteria bacterium RIFOXYD2_FULL_44_9]
MDEEKIRKEAIEFAKKMSFSEFFLHASESEKESVFREAAQKANEDQLRVFERSSKNLKAKTS